MTVFTSIDWASMTDASIVQHIGEHIREVRLKKNITQQQLADRAGLNRYTVSQIEKGASITLTSLIQLLRALDRLDVLSSFEVREPISPLAYVKLQKKQRQRARNKDGEDPSQEEDLGW